MKKEERKTLKDKTIAELHALVVELSTKLAQLRLQFKAGKQPKVSIKLTADDLARVKTILSVKQQEE